MNASNLNNEYIINKTTKTDGQGLIKTKQFLNQIFKDLKPNEHILTWGSAKTSMSYPVSTDTFFTRTLRGNKIPKACYFSTATVHKDKDSKLYNRQNLFVALYCIVLDDIGSGLGSKCTEESLNSVLRDEYSWKIETSPRNYQYGYLLDKPIRDLKVAKEFVRAIYNAGMWDSGGAMPNKLARLPCGFNLKAKYKTDGNLWQVHNADNNNYDSELNVFSPDELLNLTNAGVKWSDIKDLKTEKLDPKHLRGTTIYRENVLLETNSGIVDDVLEWMVDNEILLNEGTEWFNIKCPWHEGHSDSELSAGYKPLGYGADPDKRGFHCFHDHCNANHTREFLSWVAEEGGPEAAVDDPVPALVSRWALDTISNSFIDMNSETPMVIPYAGFKTGHQQDVFWYDAKEKLQRTSQFNLIVKSKNLLKLSGCKYLPGAPTIIDHKDERGVTKLRFLNEWSIPNWPIKKRNDSDTARKNIGTFVNFLKYLMPYNGDIEWFLDHLAAKAQNPVYRGPCVILTTPAQGSGRGTLIEMLGKLWGKINIGSTNLLELISGLAGKDFNDWLKAVWIIVSEAKESEMSRKQELRAYESLKIGIDPKPTTHLLKTKWGGQELTEVFSSYIICSNHLDFLNIPANDRRSITIDCTVEVESVEFFEKLNDWMTTSWCVDIWQMLLDRNISHHKGFAPAREQNTGRGTDNRSRLLGKLISQSPVERIITIVVLFANKHCNGLIQTTSMSDALYDMQTQIGLSDHKSWEGAFKRLMQSATTELKYKNARRSLKIGGRKCFLRHTIDDEGFKTQKHINKTNDFDWAGKVVTPIDKDLLLKFIQDTFYEVGL